MSKNGVLARMHSRSGSAAALFVLLAQLLFVGLVPAADARAAAADTRSWLGVHVEKPGVHHRVHDPGDCVFCVSMQLGAVPAQFGEIPAAGPTGSVAAVPEAARPYTPVVLTSQVARAPPSAA